MIRGLSSYIDSLSSGTHWRDAKLSKCPIVLDGKCLSHNLPGDFDWKFGGQYLAIRDSLENLIKALLAQNVSPIHVVFDGVYQTDKMDMLKGRRQEIHNTIRKKLLGQDLDEHQEMNPRPPLVANTFHKVLKNYQSEGVRVYPADGDCYPLAVSLANTYDCYLVGESSDYFITPLQKGYIPLSKLAWSQPGSPVMGRVFKRDSFIASLNFEPDLIYAIPALVGNATLPNLVDETELISLVRDNPRYRGKLSEVTIKFLQEKCDCELIGLKGQILSLANGLEVLKKFEQSFEKAKKKYDVNNPTFNYEEFKMSIAYRSDNWKSVPQWIVQQYKEFMFSPSLLAVFISGVNLLHVIPDDCTTWSKPASMIISRPIRQIIYELLCKGRHVTEIIRQGTKLSEYCIGRHGHMEIGVTLEEMKLEQKEKRQKIIYETLMCRSHALSLLEEEWHLPVASVIFWAKSAAIPRGDIYLKALVLSFAKCFHKFAATYTPAFSLEALHLYAQWQCVYLDVILLNQVLALPLLPHLSPADLFDGKLVTYYSQRSNDEFDMILANTSREILQLYTKILKTVYDNI